MDDAELLGLQESYTMVDGTSAKKMPQDYSWGFIRLATGSLADASYTTACLGA